MTVQRKINLGQGVIERAVQFESGEHRLAGNLISCDAPADSAILFIHGFGGVRSGPHNLLTHLARELAKNGVPSLRFDLSGRGESTGDPQGVTLAGMAEDALSAAALLKSQTNISKLTIVGICSGGNVGIGILDRLPECDSLFLLSVYPFGDADSFSRDAKRSAAMLREYWRKLWIADTWKRLVRGDIQFRIIVGTLMKPFAKRKSKKAESEPEKVDAKHPLDNVLIASPRILMLYGDADPEYGLSTAYYNAFSEEKGAPLDIRTIEGANHNFYSMEWKYQITKLLNAFIEEKV